MKITIDLETRSPVDLKKCGIYRYQEHPLTDVICLALKVDDKAPRIWVNSRYDTSTWAVPFEFITLEEVNELHAKADIIEAHNASFERLLWNGFANVLGKMTTYGFDPLPMEKLHCSAARAAAVSLPRSLGGACKALGLAEQKSYTGYQLMLKMCKPRKPTKEEIKIIAESRIQEIEDGVYFHEKLGQYCLWHEETADLINLCRYCCQDTNSEYDLSAHIPELSKRERQVYLLDQKINDRGIQVDIAGAKKIIDMVKVKEQKLLLEIEKLTLGKMKSARQTEKLKSWLSDEGIQVGDVRKDTIKEVLKDLPEGTAKRVLQIRQSLSKASVAKFDAIIRMANKDERVRGMFLYHAAGTGRFAGKGLQVQNLKRESVEQEELEALLTLDISTIEALHDCVIILASKCVRGMLMSAPDKELVACDLNAIESRVLAWLAGDEKMLENFRRGLDPYKIAAEGIYGVKYECVTKDQRQIGKVAELALGYQGHIGAFIQLAEGYGVKVRLDVNPEDRATILALLEMPEEDTAGLTNAELYEKLYEQKVADICNRWRRSRPMITAFWRNMEDASIQTVTTGKAHTVGKIGFFMQDKFLMMRLPSGKCIAYYNPTVVIVTRNGKQKQALHFWGTESSGGKKTEWTKQATYGGKLVENAVQGTAREILVDSMARLERAGYPIVLHVHDEDVAEMPIGKAVLADYEKLMYTNPPWTAGLPLKAKGWIGRRYRKD